MFRRHRSGRRRRWNWAPLRRERRRGRERRLDRRKARHHRGPRPNEEIINKFVIERIINSSLKNKNKNNKYRGGTSDATTSSALIFHYNHRCCCCCWSCQVSPTSKPQYDTVQDSMEFATHANL